MDDNSLGIPQIDGAGPIRGLGKHGQEEKGKKQEQYAPPKRGARSYFRTILKAAEASNEYCAKKGLPYRFWVYLENDDVFIDLVVLDNDGNPVEEKRKNISQEDFARVIEDVTSIEGLFFDQTA
jgi:hypothetical protein